MVHLWVIVIGVNMSMAVKIALSIGQYFSSSTVLYQYYSAYPNYTEPLGYCINNDVPTQDVIADVANGFSKIHCVSIITAIY
jgi:hypothetical protein